MGGAWIQVRLHAAGRYLALACPPGLDGEMCWRRNWFYLTNMIPVLPSFSDERSGGVTLDMWQLFPLAEEATEVPSLVGAIKALKVQGLTWPVVVPTFFHHQILPLRDRAHPLWQH
jgi:hypothetical protein